MAASLARAIGTIRAIPIAYALPAALAAICALFAAIEPVFLSLPNLINIAYQVAIIGIMALCMTFVIMTGGIDLSVGPVLAISGVAVANLLVLTDRAIVPSILGALVLAAGIGLCNGLCVAWFALPPIVVTLAMLSIVRGAALLTAGPELHLIRGPDAFLFIGSGLVAGVPFSVLVFAGLGLIAAFLQYCTTFGVSIIAIGDNERAAVLSGLRVRRIKSLAYVICALGAGIAGVIQASQVHTAASTYGTGIELDVIAAVVLGGASLSGGGGSVLRTIVGVFLIGVMNNGLSLINMPIDTQLIAKGVIIAIALSLSSI